MCSLWCCQGQRTSSSSNLNVEQLELRVSQSDIQTSQTPEDQSDKTPESQKLKQKSSQYAKVKPPTPIPEQKENELAPLPRSRTMGDVIQNPSTGASNTSLDSDYKTPPSTIAGDLHIPPHVVKTRVRKKSLSAPLPDSQDSLSFSPELSQEHHSFQMLVSKIDETEKQRQKQQEEFMKQQVKLMKQQEEFMKQQVELVKMLVTDVKDSRERAERRASTNEDGVKSPEMTFTDGGGLPLPHNTPVSCKVLARLSGHVTHKWKFLARELGIEDREIQQIRQDNQGDIQEQSYQMLLKWTQNRSSDAGSYQELGDAVRAIFRDKLYSEYVQMVLQVEGRHNMSASSQ